MRQPAAIVLIVAIVTLAGATVLGARIAKIWIENRYGPVNTYENGKERQMSGWEVAWRLRSSSGFPVMGRYHVRSFVDGRVVQEADEEVMAENKELFRDFLLRQVAGSGCRDVHAEVGDGRFNAGAICDTPDGDIHNIGYRLHGTFTVNSIALTQDATLWQHALPAQQTHYRLSKAAR